MPSAIRITVSRKVLLTGLGLVLLAVWPALAAPAPWEAGEAACRAEARRAAGHAERFLAEDLHASRVKVPGKPATVNPQKNSPALGATLAALLPVLRHPSSDSWAVARE